MELKIVYYDTLYIMCTCTAQFMYEMINAHAVNARVEQQKEQCITK